MRALHLGFVVTSLLLVACSDAESVNPGPTTASSTGEGGQGEGGKGQGGSEQGGGGHGGEGVGGKVDCGPPNTKGIQHVIVVVQENHTFDSYFGSYCTAAPGSNPTCTDGPSCCEAAPSTEPSGASPKDLTDDEHSVFDPDHTQACEIDEIDGGAMDKFVTGASCSDEANFAIAGKTVMKPYHDLAGQSAIADRYFQPIAGQSSSNDMYLAVAKEVFIDNAVEPDAVGAHCSFNTNIDSYKNETTVADLLIGAGKTVNFYAGGYKDMVDAGDDCPTVDSSICPLGALHVYPCVFDPSDIPFLYYAQFAKDPSFMRDYDTRFAVDVHDGKLPDVTYVKAIGYHSEHPGYGTKISTGEAFVTNLIKTVEDSCYADDTLILVTWDEGGGYFDHVSPPPRSTVDNQPYGTRIPLIAVGPFAKKNAVSHVVMEHSSIVKFLEFLYLDGQTGQLGTRDGVVNNIGSLLDETKTQLTIPDQ